jgi:hypothetical protein
MTANVKKKYLQDFLLMTFTVCLYFRIFYFPFFRRFTFLVFFFFFGKTFCSLRDFHVVLLLGELSSAAPTAWSAASGPAPVLAPRPIRFWLASSRIVAASPSTLLASRVIVSAQVRRQLAGQPQRGGGTGFGVGGGADLAAFPAGGGVALTGITDSSLALLVAGSCVSPPPAMCAISFVAAILVAFEVRWTPSPAQMLVPSTVNWSRRLYRQCGWEGVGGVKLCWRPYSVPDHIQNLKSCYTTPNNNLGGGGLIQINTCR